MNNYTIENFWSNVLPQPKLCNFKNIKGWYSNLAAESGFVEAPLSALVGFGADVNPYKSKIILVSAPGAVGKTTLAREISTRTGAVYIDLAEAEPVGGNTIYGGLAKSGLLAEWQGGAISLLIDGLDEARLKVTQEGFESFLDDVFSLVEGAKQPIVLFGRTGAVQDTWLILEEKKRSTPILGTGYGDAAVLEIGYYGAAVAVDFAITRLNVLKPDSQHPLVEKKVLEKILLRLRNETSEDGDRFAGYAPVLKAIADYVAGDRNPASILAKIEKGEQSITLDSILQSILLREKEKLNSLPFEDITLRDHLYTQDEQMLRLIALIYNSPTPASPSMSPRDAQIYSNALETWVVEHPFLDGNRKPSSAVFEAAIVSRALKLSSIATEVALKELAKGAAANPFIPEFYFANGEDKELPPEHIGVIYASLRARLAQGDQASLSFEGFDDENEDKIEAEVEITITRLDEALPRVRKFVSNQAENIRLGSHLEDIEITANISNIEIGGARELLLIPPISIQCRKIDIKAERIIVEAPAQRMYKTVLLEAETADVSSISGVPLINGDTKLIVIWDGAERFPWSAHRGDPAVRHDPKEKEALRRFRKFVIAFRSHSKGSLKRLADKLDHERMTRGVGKMILDKLKEERIITKDKMMYELNADLLAEKTGAEYSKTMAQIYSEKTIEFLLNIMKDK